MNFLTLCSLFLYYRKLLNYVREHFEFFLLFSDFSNFNDNLMKYFISKYFFCSYIESALNSASNAPLFIKIGRKLTELSNFLTYWPISICYSENFSSFQRHLKLSNRMKNSEITIFQVHQPKNGFLTEI